jgi:hypothetical protein
MSATCLPLSVINKQFPGLSIIKASRIYVESPEVLAEFAKLKNPVMPDVEECRDVEIAFWYNGETLPDFRIGSLTILDANSRARVAGHMPSVTCLTVRNLGLTGFNKVFPNLRETTCIDSRVTEQMLNEFPGGRLSLYEGVVAPATINHNRFAGLVLGNQQGQLHLRFATEFAMLYIENRFAVDISASDIKTLSVNGMGVGKLYCNIQQSRSVYLQSLELQKSSSTTANMIVMYNVSAASYAGLTAHVCYTACSTGVSDMNSQVRHVNSRDMHRLIPDLSEL